ncbi:MAG: DUF3854 domain-containing protein [Candidatus Entotheonellia bacterium]
MKNTSLNLYISPGIREQITDPTIPLLIIEGEKKALTGVQAGFCCVGTGGIWSFTRIKSPSLTWTSSLENQGCGLLSVDKEASLLV